MTQCVHIYTSLIIYFTPHRAPFESFLPIATAQQKDKENQSSAFEFESLWTLMQCPPKSVNWSCSFRVVLLLARVVEGNGIWEAEKLAHMFNAPLSVVGHSEKFSFGDCLPFYMLQYVVQCHVLSWICGSLLICLKDLLRETEWSQCIGRFK